MFLAALDQTIVSTSIRTIADDLDGLSDPGLGDHGVPDHLDHHHADLRQARRPLRPQEAVHVRDLGLHRRLGAVRVRDVDVRARGVPGVPGLGAGGLFTLVLAIIGDIVSPRERARYTGYFMATFATSSVLGPVIGGFFAGQDEILGVTGWRWVFLVNVPVGIAALIVVFRTLHLSHTPRAGPHRLVGSRRPGGGAGPAAHRGRAGPRVGLGLRPLASRRTSSAGSGWSRSTSPSERWATPR